MPWRRREGPEKNGAPPDIPRDNIERALLTFLGHFHLDAQGGGGTIAGMREMGAAGEALLPRHTWGIRKAEDLGHWPKASGPRGRRETKWGEGGTVFCPVSLSVLSLV